MRLVIIGNSGSWKSTLAERFGATQRLPNHDLDHFHWQAHGLKGDEAEAKAFVTEVAIGTHGSSRVSTARSSGQRTSSGSTCRGLIVAKGFCDGACNAA